MVKLNYQKYGNKEFQLRLRLYKDGETKYYSVTRFLKGNIKPHHWDQKSQKFTEECPKFKENNTILSNIKKKFESVAWDWNGSVFGIISGVDFEEENDAPTLSEYIKTIADRAKKNAHPDGTLKSTFEEYLKFDKRLQEFCSQKKIQ